MRERTLLVAPVQQVLQPARLLRIPWLRHQRVQVPGYPPATLA